jgi:hypothetical protein
MLTIISLFMHTYGINVGLHCRLKLKKIQFIHDESHLNSNKISLQSVDIASYI